MDHKNLKTSHSTLKETFCCYFLLENVRIKSVTRLLSQNTFCYFQLSNYMSTVRYLSTISKLQYGNNFKQKTTFSAEITTIMNVGDSNNRYESCCDLVVPTIVLVMVLVFRVFRVFEIILTSTGRENLNRHANLINVLLTLRPYKNTKLLLLCHTNFEFCNSLSQNVLKL